MPAMPVLVIGLDAAWRTRMQRLLAMRAELDWLGAYAPAQPRESRHGPPALLLLDGDDPRADRVRRRPALPAPRRLYFYRNPNVAALHHCIETQAHACLDKHDSPDTVMRAILAAESGLFVVAPQLLLEAVHDGTDMPAPAPLPDVPLHGDSEALRGDWSGLTERQREIVRWAARGMSNKQIARQLGISPETVKTHLHHVFEREGVHGRMALLAAHLGEERP